MLGQIGQLDSSLERARNLYMSASAKLQRIEHSLKINRIALHAARSNLRVSQAALMQRLVVIYTSRDDQSTLAVLLGATSIDDLVNRIETVNSVSQQDVAVIRGDRLQEGCNEAPARAEAGPSSPEGSVQQRPRRSRITWQLERQRRLLSSIKGDRAAHRGATTAAARAARAASRAHRLLPVPGVRASADRDGRRRGRRRLRRAPSQYGGVVGIAMQYLGTPYVWGGATGGFDAPVSSPTCTHRSASRSPHYTGAQWNVGVGVS